MSMFNDDARPVTPWLAVVGETASRGAYARRITIRR